MNPKTFTITCNYCGNDTTFTSSVSVYNEESIEIYSEGEQTNIAIYCDKCKTEITLQEVSMGLDMYLERANKVKSGGNLIFKVEEKLGYWRKANHIHKWFVDNVQNGTDDCGCYPVTKEQLMSLQELCKLSLDKNDPTLLPTQSGFFFGNTDVDDWYWSQTKRTIEIIEYTLSETDFENEIVVYNSSWQEVSMQIDWSKAPEWAMWHAFDENGEGYWYSDKPLTLNSIFSCSKGTCVNSGYDYETQIRNWYETLEYRTEPTQPTQQPKPDYTAQLLAIIEQQCAKGLAKYGVSLEDADLSAEELIEHALQEIADLSQYMIALRDKMKKDKVK